MPCRAASRTVFAHSTAAESLLSAAGQALEFLRKHTVQGHKPSTPMLQHLTARTEFVQVLSARQDVPLQLLQHCQPVLKGAAYAHSLRLPI